MQSVVGVFDASTQPKAEEKVLTGRSASGEKLEPVTGAVQST
jgi:hypothetical protein